MDNFVKIEYLNESNALCRVCISLKKLNEFTSKLKNCKVLKIETINNL